MNKIPTAEEFFSINHGLYTAYSVKNKDNELVQVVSIDKAVEFTKLHVKAALESAAQKAELGYADGRYELPDYAEEPFNAVIDDLGNANYIDRNSILKAYPDELIK